MGAGTNDNTGGTVSEGSVADVSVTSDPAYISSTPVDILVMVVKGVLEGRSSVQHVTSDSVKNTFRFARGTAERAGLRLLDITGYY